MRESNNLHYLLSNGIHWINEEDTVDQIVDLVENWMEYIRKELLDEGYLTVEENAIFVILKKYLGKREYQYD